MPSYRELLQQVKDSIEEVDATQARDLLDAAEPPLLVDVRERDEWAEGHIPGAVHVPRGFLESRIEQVAPDRARPLVLYCAGGTRSAFAAKTLTDLGYAERRPRSPAASPTGSATACPSSCPARSTRRSGSATAATC